MADVKRDKGKAFLPIVASILFVTLGSFIYWVLHLHSEPQLPSETPGQVTTSYVGS